MIKKISFVNFGGFENLSLDLKPITILCGPSLKKSSIWKTILNIKNIIKNSDHDLLLDTFEKHMNGPSAYIGFLIELNEEHRYHGQMFSQIPIGTTGKVILNVSLTLYKEHHLYEDVHPKIEVLMKCCKYKKMLEIDHTILYLISNILDDYVKEDIEKHIFHIKNGNGINNGTYEHQNSFIFEHPEAHYHAIDQQKMADYFINLFESGKHTIVETYSENLLVTRLVRRIVECKNAKLEKNIAIYYFTGNSNGKCERITTEHTKGIVNWPNNFADQAADDHVKIILGGVEKRKKLGKIEKNNYRI